MCVGKPGKVRKPGRNNPINTRRSKGNEEIHSFRKYQQAYQLSWSSFASTINPRVSGQSVNTSASMCLTVLSIVLGQPACILAFFFRYLLFFLGRRRKFAFGLLARFATPWKSPVCPWAFFMTRLAVCSLQHAVFLFS